MSGRVLPFITLFLILYVIAAVPDGKGQGTELQQGIELFNEGEYERATDLFNSLTERYPNIREPYLMLAATYLERGFPILAESTAEEGSRKFEDEAGFTWLIAESLLRQNQPGKAAELYRDLFRYYETYSFSELLGITERRIRNRWIDAELMLSVEAYQAGDIESADRALQTVLRLNPDHLQALKNRVFLAMETDNWNRVIELAEHGMSKHPEDLDFIRMKANAYYQMEDLESMLVQYERLYRNDPHDIDTAINYAEILFANQRGGDAEQVYLDLLQKYDDDIRIYRSFVRLQERRMYIESKVSVLEVMIEQFPEDEEAYRDLAETYEMLEEWEKAQEAWLELETLTGESEEIRMNIARIRIEQGDLEKAESILRNYIASTDDAYSTIGFLGELLQEQQRWQESLEVLYLLPEELKTGDFGFAVAHAYYQTGDIEKSRNLLEQFISTGQEEPQIYLLLARIVHSEEYGLSLEMAKKAVITGFERLRRYNSIIEAELEQGSVFTEMSVTRDEVDVYNEVSEKALDFLLEHFNREDIQPVLENLLEQYRESPIFYYKMASFRNRHGEHEAAMQLLTDALAVNPRYYDAHFLRGEIFETRENLEQAELSYQRALSIDPESRDAYRSLIRIHRKMGTLDALATRWKVRYRAERENELLREFLIEVLQRADRFEEARELIDQ
jgi:tetratricopeptide (TPR) repeat protein